MGPIRNRPPPNRGQSSYHDFERRDRATDPRIIRRFGRSTIGGGGGDGGDGDDDGDGCGGGCSCCNG